VAANSASLSPPLRFSDPFTAAIIRSIGAASPASAACTAAGKSARSTGSKSPSNRTFRIAVRWMVAARRFPRPFTTKPRGW
jgi:hypothetical protein